MLLTELDDLINLVSGNHFCASVDVGGLETIAPVKGQLHYRVIALSIGLLIHGQANDVRDGFTKCPPRLRHILTDGSEPGVRGTAVIDVERDDRNPFAYRLGHRRTEGTRIDDVQGNTVIAASNGLAHFLG